MSVIAEIPLQFQMGPVIQGIADQLLQSFGPFLKFLPGRGVAGDEGLFDAVGTHLPPFVVIAAQPDLGNIGKLSVLCDVLGADMAVIVQNRHGFGIVVVELSGTFRVQ